MKTSINFEEEEFVNNLIDRCAMEEENIMHVINNLVLITETNLQGRGIDRGFQHNLHQEHPCEFLQKLRESQIPSTWDVVVSF